MQVIVVSIYVEDRQAAVRCIFALVCIQVATFAENELPLLIRNGAKSLAFPISYFQHNQNNFSWIG
jgi:hypothetical protein